MSRSVRPRRHRGGCGLGLARRAARPPPPRADPEPERRHPPPVLAPL